MKWPVTPRGSPTKARTIHVNLSLEALHDLRNAIQACFMFAELAVTWEYLTLAEADEVQAVLKKLSSLVDDVGATRA